MGRDHKGGTKVTWGKPDHVTQANWDLASRDSELGVGHLWTRVECPAYPAFDPTLCNCQCKWDATSASECAMFRERAVAGSKTPPETCKVHPEPCHWCIDGKPTERASACVGEPICEPCAYEDHDKHCDRTPAGECLDETEGAECPHTWAANSPDDLYRDLYKDGK